MNTKTAYIEVGALPGFCKEVKRLNRRASKVGVSEITFVVGEQVNKTRKVFHSQDGETSEHSYPVSCFEIEVTLPAFEDYKWQLAATITPNEGRVFVDSHIAGFDIAPYHTADVKQCDHCNMKRARSLVYVVRNIADGSLQQVGRNCFADYVGSKGLGALEFKAVLDTFFRDDEGECFFPAAGAVDSVRLLDILVRAEAIALHMGGWRNNGKDEFGMVISPGTHRLAASTSHFEAEFYGKVSETNSAVAKLAADPALIARVEADILTMQEMDCGDNEFGQMLAYCAGFEFIPTKKAAAVAYLCEFVRGEARKAALEAKKATMTHVGTVGKREVFTQLTLVRCHTIDGYYGITTFYNFEDPAGNALVWKTSSGLDMAIGDMIDLKATVKDHSEFRGIPQTNIARAVVYVPKVKKSRAKKVVA